MMKSIQNFTKSSEAIPTEINYPKMLVNGVERSVEWWDGETLETSCWISYRDEKGNTFSWETDYGIEQRNMMRLKKSGLGELVKKCTFENFVTKHQYQKIMKDKALRYIENPVGWFSVLGQSGSGKTHLCTAICNKLIKHGRTFEYMLWMQHVNEIKYKREENFPLLKKYRDVNVLYIDDFLKTKDGKDPTKVEIELAFEILDARYRDNKISIISSEKTIEQIKAYDYAVAGRIVENSGTNLLKLGKDERKDMRIT